MHNIEAAKKKFSDYVNSYDMSNDKIDLKYYHSLRVSDLCGEIAISQNMDEEQVYLARIVGLLHDIGRFEQIKKYDNYNYMKEMDHGTFGASILTDDFLKDYIDNNKYNDIIRKSVDAHNKAYVPSGYVGLELLFSKIIRDADKLDILYLYVSNRINHRLDNEEISDVVVDCFFNKKIILYEDVKTSLDQVLLDLAFVYDINFSYSFKVLSREKYIDKIIDNLNFKDEKTSLLMNDFKKLLNLEIDIRKED